MAVGNSTQISARRRRRARRSESLPVRRWLQLSAASAGVGVGLMGFALLGPQTGVAGADTAGETAQSSGPSGSESASTSRGDSDSAGSGAGASGAEADDAGDEDAGDEDAGDDEDAADEDAADEAAESSNPDEDRSGNDERTDIGSDDTGFDDTGAADETPAGERPETGAAPDRVETDEVRATQTDPAAAAPAVAPVAARRATPDNWSEFAGAAITSWTRSSQGWINSLPVDGAAKYHLEGALLATRRSLFNQAPTVAPIQVSGKIDGPIVGRIGAVDPEGDRLTYVIAAGPTEGTLQLNRDGTYTYTPGTAFDGVDSFRVVAVDNGWHVNLLDPLRPWGTRATHLINQRAITFEFNYTTGAEHWTVERRDALQDSADALLVYFTVGKPVLLTYDVSGEDNPLSRTLASAGSPLISTEPGFWPTVVQHELLTGIDANGAEADGEIEWNFGTAWALGDTVGPGEFDFQSTAMHELLHSFGFLSYTEAPGDNERVAWATFDRFVVTRQRERPITRDHEWDTDFDPYLIGHDGGLFFAGRHATEAYGGDLVPLYSPDPYEEGSSGSHLDDVTFAGANQMLMNAMTDRGLGVRVLSPIEIGILRDLGYRVNAPAPATFALGLIGFLFVGRLRRNWASAPN